MFECRGCALLIRQNSSNMQPITGCTRPHTHTQTVLADLEDRLRCLESCFLKGTVRSLVFMPDVGG